eukprot:TRINITY_DN25286_c0_g1_i9.p3 TRINITY_DN25286_c0_g1~~TRINITY_DN25286_c0_g1_i9.p3  ORF type:complete len:100 (+),score=8.14 TRINITY_DN25286_c0_g1_i9:239-538(+)
MLFFIGNNCIGGKGAKEIGLSLQKNSTLTTLNLVFIGNNNIGDEGAKEIGLGLQKNKTLTTLNLSMFFVQHHRYSSQGIIVLEVKEQKKSELHCRRIIH